MKNLLGFVEQRKKMGAEAQTVQVGAIPITSPSFYRPDALPAAQLHGSRQQQQQRPFNGL